MTATAIRTALELHSIPSRVRAARVEPLPSDIEQLLRVAVGETEATASAASETGRPPDVLRAATSFYIEQILLSPDADAYRMLGATRDAAPAVLRRNMALILRWVHPDLDSRAERSVFVTRVNSAWEALKSPDRRTAYDRTLAARSHAPGSQSPGSKRSSRSHLKYGKVRVPGAVDYGPRGDPNQKPGLMRILALYLSGFRRS